MTDQKRPAWVSKAPENARARFECPNCGTITLTTVVSEMLVIRIKNFGAMLFDGTCEKCGGQARVSVDLRPAGEG